MKDKLIELIEATKKMRRLQIKYFAANSVQKQKILPLSKDAERKVDKLLDSFQINNGNLEIVEQTGLF